MPYKREDKDKKIPKKKLLDIHNAVAKVVHELRTEWSQAKEIGFAGCPWDASMAFYIAGCIPG